MIRTEALSRRYHIPATGPLWRRSAPKEVMAVEALDMEIPRGAITGLLGLNGAGKTTTIKMLTTLLLPSGGRAAVDGLDLVRDAQLIRQRINLIAGGERMLYWRLTGRENLWYFGRLYGIATDILQKRIADLLAAVGLTEAAAIPVERYSKGMKQRLQIARGLINDPDYLFMDEPTLGLDLPIARDLRVRVQELAINRQKGVLLTSHYMAEVEALCTHIYVIDQGRHVVQGTAAKLKALAGQVRRLRIMLAVSASDLLQELRTVAAHAGGRVEEEWAEGSLSVTLATPEDVSAATMLVLARWNAPVIKMETLEPTLEDAMLALMGRGG